MKALILPAMLLLLAACAGTGANDDASQDPFVAPEVAPDATEREAKPALIQPLTAQEESDAAMLIARLEQTPEQAERDQVLRKLIELGPRYLPFFRRISRDAVLLDMMYVIRKIEGDPPASGQVSEDPSRRTGNGEESPGSAAPPTTGEYNPEEVEKYWGSLLRQAQRMLEAGRYDAAARIAESAIVLRPESRWRAEFDSVIVRARSEGQAEMIIAGTMAPEPSAVQYAREERAAPFATPVQIRCYLKNVSAQEITLRLNEGEGRQSVLQLQIRYEQGDYLGHNMGQQDTVILPIDAGAAVTLKPGDSYELAVPLTGLSSLDADAPLKKALGKAEFDASLRVYGATDSEGNPMILRPIRFSTQSIMVFPALFDLVGAADKPLTYMRQCIEKELAQELYLSAQLVDARSLRNAGDILIADDFEDSPLNVQRARLRSASSLFGVGPAWDIRQWRKWWEENRLRDHAKVNG